MAAFGAKYINFAPITEEPENRLPEYGEKVNVGALVKADVTINLASGEIYGDDALDEKLEEFVSATIATEVTDMTDEVESAVFGSKIEGKELIDSTGDEIPQGGLGYYKTLLRNGKKKYRAYYYPKVKASMGNDTAQTKGNSITFSSTSLSFTVYEPKIGKWRYRETFDREQDAIRYVNEKLGVKASPSVELYDAGAAPLGGSVTVGQMMADGAKLEDDGNGNVTVTATFHKVENFPEFSNTKAEQSGYFFPCRIPENLRGEKMTLKKDGVVGKGKTDIPFDPELVIRLEKKEASVVEILIDSEPKVKMTFAGSTFEE